MNSYVLKICVPFLIICGSINTAATTNSSTVNYNAGVCPLFCKGPLLHYVQMTQLFNDSKYFVDMTMKTSPSAIESKFEELLSLSNNNTIKKDEFLSFIDKYFYKPNTFITSWVPPDWNPQPSYINNIYDKKVREWMYDLNRRWKLLGRKVNHQFLKLNGDRSTLLPVPNPFIVPGGRFREFYYWDSYWIIEGLLVSEMFQTAKGMIDNFLMLVHEYGYVPNGGRKYYLGRSQPPFLIPMVDLYVKATSDFKYLQSSVDILEREFQFWISERSVNVLIDGIEYRVFHYYVEAKIPRPESYREDEILVQSLNETERIGVFSEIQSATESGWDFSSRWLFKDGSVSKSLKDIITSSIIPVCLNSLMSYNAKILSEFYTYTGNKNKSTYYFKLSQEINATISRIFWDEEAGIWRDYDLSMMEQRKEFYAGNLLPLYFDTFGMERDKKFVVNQVINYIKKNDFESFPGGIPTSLLESGQQWDMPNNWPPLQYFIIMGLHNARSFNDYAEDLALSLAKQWILNVYDVYSNDPKHPMFEKYNAVTGNTSGSGGEYRVQNGFGWTNAIVIKLLSMYSHQIRISYQTDIVLVVVLFLLSFTVLVALLGYSSRSCFKRMANHDFSQLSSAES